MSLQSYVNDITHSVGNDVSSGLNQLKNALSRINGSVTTSLSTLWSGGFVGMSENGLEIVESALRDYVVKVSNIVDSFNVNNDLDVSLKGEPKLCAEEFIESIRILMLAYVSTMRREMSEMREAYDNFIAAGQNISRQVSQDAAQLRSNADQIKM